MEEEDARDYNEPCGYCSAVSWSITEEGRFYCTSCHTVIEKTREVQTGDVITNARAQSISRGLRKRKNKFDKGWEWFICEGFQYILRKQAEALQSLGVSSQMKDEVLYNFWRRYLHKSKQAYSDKSLGDVTHDISSHTDTETEVESTSPINLTCSTSDIDVISEFSTAAASSVSKASAKSGWSGSVDGGSYLQKKRKGDLSLSMPMTLAFCSLALLWLRESITLSDLLRLVMDGHIPYLNAFKEFPEEMKMYGSDFKIFHVQSWPKYDDVYKKMHALAEFIDLPCFPRRPPAMAEWAPAQLQEWNVEAQHLMPLQPPLVPELSHMREAQLHTAEASLWSVVATVQAMERKIDLLATRLLSLEGRSGTAEKKLLDCEKTAMEFGNQLENKWAVLGTLIQEYGLLQRRLENMENLLKNRNFWVLRLPPGSKGEIPKMPVTFVDIAVYFSAEEWKNLADWQKDLYNNLLKENYESLLAFGANVNVAKPEVHPRAERGAPEPSVPEPPSAKERDVIPEPCTGPLASTPDILTRIKQEGAFSGGGPFSEDRGPVADPCAGAQGLMSAHDFLSWIKQEESSCVRHQWDASERETLPAHGGPAGDTMTIKAEQPRLCPEESVRPREMLFQGESPAAAVLAVPPAAESYEAPRGPPVSPTKCRAGKSLELDSELQSILGPPQGSAERPHGCSECGKMFGVKKSLKVHQRSHHGQARPYECAECRKSFNCHSGLVRHQMTHRGERPYKCAECGKCYSRKEHLQNHQRLHTGF